ncbi:unnamed protein product [Allacma fusca]|uniref:MULE transposase domain-containing protein n=1 Tax=Allacma fusca TaxID=39272 RepID=A0A8J2KU87_9HEXA|nr:unnamed protein product [Allacma fusca]
MATERCPRNKPEMMCYKFKLLSYDEDTKVLEKQEFIQKEYVYAKTLPQYIRAEPRIREEMKDAIKQAKSRQQDDLFNHYDLSVHSHGFVHLLDLANGLKVVLGISPLLDHVERLYSGNDFIYFYNDTTYYVGDSFVSILSLEHRHFRSKRDNGYPSIFDRIPSFNTEKTVLVMDREAAITNAIRLVNPDVKVFYCWRHLRENVTAKARKFLKNENELNQAIILLGKLFHTKNMMAYDYERRRLENEWPAGLIQYFQ